MIDLVLLNSQKELGFPCLPWLTEFVMSFVGTEFDNNDRGRAHWSHLLVGKVFLESPAHTLCVQQWQFPSHIIIILVYNDFLTNYTMAYLNFMCPPRSCLGVLGISLGGGI